MDKYDYLFANPNIVSLDYCEPIHQHGEMKGTEIPLGQKALCIGVVENSPDTGHLPKTAVYE